MLPQRSTKRTSAGFSEVVGAELAGQGKEDKQPAECSVNSEEAAQLESSVGQLHRFEEEEKPPEVASNGEGDVSDEDLGEIDEGLLEHAMNTGIFNDDDREHFQASIERIQTTRSTRSFVVE